MNDVKLSSTCFIPNDTEHCNENVYHTATGCDHFATYCDRIYANIYLFVDANHFRLTEQGGDNPGIPELVACTQVVRGPGEPVAKPAFIMRPFFV